ncbi:phosphate starvation-inducible protein PhoH [Solibacillus kalamii]|nr:MULTISPECIES: PhoH family protein [Solibacillus]MBM7665306.1 phosphate starvation-inducible protein PhoH [Solibacillus kalamii]
MPKAKRQAQGDVVRHPLVARVIQAYTEQEL